MKDKNFNVKTYCKAYLKICAFMDISFVVIVLNYHSWKEGGGLIFLTTNNVSRVNEVAQ